MFVFIDIGTIQHWLSTFLFVSKVPFVDFRRALPLSICERSTFMRMFDSFN